MTRPDHRQHLIIETPENVLLDYELGGLGSRTLALIADLTILILAWLVIVPLGLGRLAGLGRGVFGIVLLILTFFAVTLYFALFEGARNGSTPGKRMVGIRVIRDTGHPVTIAEAIIRNLFRTIDILFSGVLLIALHPMGKRLGDIIAGTVVVRDQPVVTAPAIEPSDESVESAASAPVLSDQQYHLLREFIRRAPQLPPASRDQWAARLADQLDTAKVRREEPLAWLMALHREESAIRRGTGAVRSSGTWERLVARKSPRWEEFQPIADRVSRSGLGVLSASGLVDFAARYRELTADLARARTYRADAAALQRLERLVAAGHNALYRARPRSWSRIVRFFTEDAPAEAVRSGPIIAAAFLVFVAAGFAGYATVREQPFLAEQLLPDVMLERAAAGDARRAAGVGYFVAEAAERPTMAGMLFLNNFRVCLITFSTGAFLGIGSFVIVALNGAMIGTTTGHFANVGLAGYLLSFIAAHGPLELTAIWISGAAGFLLGIAIIRPGRRTRQQALVVAGRRALRLLGVVAPFILVAALIEGLLSAGEYDMGTRFLAAGVSFLVMAGYWWQGTRVLGNRALPD